MILFLCSSRMPQAIGLLCQFQLVSSTVRSSKSGNIDAVLVGKLLNTCACATVAS
ncbi:MAG: hypothetical protein ACXWWC_11365 [Chitinophagaceae bacterium]